MRIAVIGAGLMGLATAQRLAAHGHQVEVFDGSAQSGGLSTWEDYGPFIWDRFYHVILPSDRHLISFIRSLGLAEKLQWRRTRTGVWVDGRIFDMSSTADYLRFPLLGPWQKVRLAWTILLGSLIRRGTRLERMPVSTWLIRHSGRATFERFWKPLLLAKLGPSYEQVSATFIWTYIKRLFSARDPSAGRESLGYVEGGYKTVLERLERYVALNGSVHFGATVNAVSRSAETDRLSVATSLGNSDFDQVVFTGPVPEVRRVIDRDLLDVQRDAGDVQYLGVSCLVLITKRELCPYYVLNLADSALPFTGVIGMSSLVDQSETEGLFLTYFPKYTLSTDAIFDAPEAEVLDQLWRGVISMYPEISDDDVVARRLHRARIVQPLQVLGYSELVPKVATHHPGLFILNTSQIREGTLNNNEVIGAVTRFSDWHAERYAAIAQ